MNTKNWTMLLVGSCLVLVTPHIAEAYMVSIGEAARGLGVMFNLMAAIVVGATMVMITLAQWSANNE